MANTPNFALYKPSRGDTSVEVDTSLSDNFTKIDTELKTNKDDITTHKNNPSAHTSENITHADGSVRTILDNHEERLGGLETDTEDLDTRVTDIETLGLEVLAPNLEGRIQTIESDVEGFLAPATFDAMDQQSYTFDEYRIGYVHDKAVIKGDLVINVRDFGAKSLHEVTNFDSTAAIQAAIDSVSTYSFSRGATIFFPLGVYKFSEVLISTKHVTLTGVGVLKGTIKVRGVESADPVTNNVPDMFTHIQGLKFIHDVGNTTDAIVFQNMRVATVEGCYFENYRNAIYGESLRNDIPYQVTSRVSVDGCRFRNVDYAVKTTWKIYDVPVPMTPSTWRYNQHGDWQVTNNQMYFYSRGTTHVHMEGQDGLVCTNNIMFHALYSQQNQVKEHNIYLKQSNFAIISNNDLFEAGYESIYCTDPRSLIIKGNNIAWCGQRDPRSGIYVEVADQSTYDEANIIIDSNNIAYPTRHGVQIGFFTTNAKVSNNTITKIGVGNFYYGATAIGSVSHYGVFVGDPTPTFTEKERVVVTGNFYDGTIYQNRGISLNNISFANADTGVTFGGLVTGVGALSGTLDLTTKMNRNNNPINPNAPFILKSVTGTLDSITGAKQGQMVTIVGGVGGVVLNNNTAPDTFSIGAQTTVLQSQAITLQKTDTYWVKM